jgi:hypothetical protein
VQSSDNMIDRRRLLAAGSAFGMAAMAGRPAAADAPDAPSHASDWRWLVGNWDVDHWRLRERLAGDTRWDAFKGTSAVWLTMGGLGTIDDNVLDLPGGLYRATGIRAFDPAAGKWLIWWLDGRNPTRIDAPVMGTFDGDAGAFTGRDTFRGKPILVRFRWRDIHGPRPNWDQAFSANGGATWEVNWRNAFTRTSAEPAPLPRLADRQRDFDFLVGTWRVEHRRLRQRLAGSRDWERFDGTLVNWPVLGGDGNVGDNLMNAPSGAFRGVGLRAFDPARGEWLSWWLDGRDPSVIGAPLRGRFANSVGAFFAEETTGGRTVRTRVIWSEITAASARWEQASSADGGPWEVNWISNFRRQA